MSALVLFGPYNMTSGKCSVSETDVRSLPKNIIQREQVARRHGTVQVNYDFDEKSVGMRGRIKRPSGHTPTFRQIQDEFDNAMSKNQRYLRLARTRTVVTDADSATNWSVADDATNASLDASTYQVSNGALNFDVDVSASVENYATVYNSSLTAVDLSAVSESGNLEFWVFLPNVTFITSLDFRIGSDTSSYWYENTITTNYENRPLEPGWNYISVYWPTMEESGVPDASALDYVYVRVNYTSGMVDTTGFLLNGFAWVDEDNCENYAATVEKVDMQEVPGNIDWQPFTVSFLCNNPFSVATHSEMTLERDTLTSVSKEIDIELEGSYAPSPLIVYTINTPEGLAEILYSNQTTQEQISVATAWTADDVFTIDTETMRCYLNSAVVDYDGTFPRHVVGFNKVKTVLTSATAVTVDYSAQYYRAYIPITNLGPSMIAQSFNPTATGTLSDVAIALAKYGEGSPTCQVYIYSDSVSSPSAVLAYLGSMQVNNTITAGTYPLTHFYPSLSVSNGTTYWITLSFTVPAGCGLAASVSTTPYASHYLKYKTSAGTWSLYSGSASAWDMGFKVTTQPAFTVNYDWDISYRKRFI